MNKEPTSICKIFV